MCIRDRIWGSHLVNPEEMRLIKTQSMLDNGKAMALDRAEAKLNERMDMIADSMSIEYAKNIETELRRYAGIGVPLSIPPPTRPNGEHPLA